MLTETEVNQILVGFQAGTLDREEWNHRSHLIAGLQRVLTGDDASACAALRTEIERLGAYNRLKRVYNTTVTEAWVKLLRAYVEANPGRSLTELVNELPAPMLARTFIHKFYSEDHLYARGHDKFVEPDRAPLDFRAG